MKLIDAHCHLQDERIDEKKLDDILADAHAAGLQQFVVNGCWQEDWNRVILLGQKYPGAVLPQIGLHPWWVGRRSADWLPRLRELLENHPTVGLGECGLDKGPKAPQDADFSQQLEVFKAQLQLAEELQRPVSVHCVRAFGAVADALQSQKITVPVVLHAWTGAAEMTASLLQLPNVYFSLNGYLTKLPPQKAIAMIQIVPLERVLLESDCPDGHMCVTEAWAEALPELKRMEEKEEEYSAQGKEATAVAPINTPRVVLRTLALVAAAMNKPQEEVAAASYSNARRIFCSDVIDSTHT